MNAYIIWSLLTETGAGLEGLTGGGAVNDMMQIASRRFLNSETSSDFMEHMKHILVKEALDYLVNKILHYFQENNGKFFGQIVGKFVSTLSAVSA